MTKEADVKKSSWKKGALKYAFAGVVSWGALGYYAPSATASITEAVEAQVEHLTQQVDLDEILPAKKIEEYPEPEDVIVNEGSVQLFGPITEKDMMIQLSENWHRAWGKQKIAMQNPALAQKMERWLSSFDHLKGRSIAEKVKGVSWSVNRTMMYTSDFVTSPRENKSSDYWFAPIESLLSGEGDEEDYILLKYAALRHLDVPAERLFVVAVGPSSTNDNYMLVVDIHEKTLGQAMASDSLPHSAVDYFGLQPDHKYLIVDTDERTLGLKIQKHPSIFEANLVIGAQGVIRGKDWRQEWSKMKSQNGIFNMLM